MAFTAEPFAECSVWFSELLGSQFKTMSKATQIFDVVGCFLAVIIEKNRSPQFEMLSRVSKIGVGPLSFRARAAARWFRPMRNTDLPYGGTVKETRKRITEDREISKEQHGKDSWRSLRPSVANSACSLPIFVCAFLAKTGTTKLCLESLSNECGRFAAAEVVTSCR